MEIKKSLLVGLLKFLGNLSKIVLVFSFLFAAFSCNKENPISNNNIVGTVTDADGNTYQTVKIGNQVWMAENLRTTKYNDGTPITLDTSTATWNSGIAGKYCYYNNTANADSIRKNGALYNWFAVNTGKLAPAGWHVPSDAEWNILLNYLIANGYNWDGTKDSNKVAKSLAAKTDWTDVDRQGDPGNDQSNNNKSGFSAFPSGDRYFGYFEKMGRTPNWWSETEDNSLAISWGLDFDQDLFQGGQGDKNTGFSVRLLKDN
jgi:Fibrobacter succinogenes major domain (Fib_succ_major).